MHRIARGALFVAAALALFLAAGFFLQEPWATRIWPVPSGPLSNIFVASILAAIGAPIIWIAWSGETRAIAGGAVNLVVANGAIAFASDTFLRHGGPPVLLPFAAFAAIVAAGCAWLFLYSRRFAFLDQRPTPWWVRISFGLFAVTLLLTASALILVYPNIFPWPLSRENSIFYGSIFLGNMCYFLYGILYPCWGNARGQLVAFLAYDLVLIVPFAQRFGTVPSDMLLSLIVYTAVISYSGLLAIFFLFANPNTRFRLLDFHGKSDRPPATGMKSARSSASNP